MMRRKDMPAARWLRRLAAACSSSSLPQQRYWQSSCFRHCSGCARGSTMTKSIFERLPAPPAAETLGWELIARGSRGRARSRSPSIRAKRFSIRTARSRAASSPRCSTTRWARLWSARLTAPACPRRSSMNVSFIRAGEARAGDRQGPRRQPGQDHRLPRGRIVRRATASCSPAPPRARAIVSAG